MRVIDSHTGGEPTRLVIEGGPDLGHGPLSARRALLAERHDHLRGFCLSEPRGFDAIVGAYLTEPVDPAATAGLIFFNNAGYLGMCGHGTIGAVVTLAHLGRIGPGTHLIETPVGPVTARLEGRNRVTIDNVASYLLHADVELDVDGIGKVRGDVAWGGNWFFLTEDSPVAIEPRNIPQLTAAGLAVKAELTRRGIVGDDGGEVDHIEFFGPGGPGADSRNFVLCPGAAYDRSPCGTGTSAKLACLAAHGLLAPGAVWVQESVIGSRFEASYRLGPAGEILPTITGEAHVTADTRLILDPSDPFPNGIF